MLDEAKQALAQYKWQVGLSAMATSNTGHWMQCLSCLLNVQALDRDACAFKQVCEDGRGREGSQAVAQGSKSFPQRSLQLVENT